jgi:prepilin-type N-terminal cleavage/methylation domain-containing protein
MTRQRDTQIKNAGFSLVELMVVMVILTIGLLPLALVQTRAQQDVFESGRFSDAVHVAQLQMESAKSLGFSNIPIDSGLVDGAFLWRRQVTNVSFGLDQITINVRWSEKGNPQTITIFDMISMR